MSVGKLRINYIGVHIFRHSRYYSEIKSRSSTYQKIENKRNICKPGVVQISALALAWRPSHSESMTLRGLLLGHNRVKLFLEFMLHNPYDG